MTEQKITDDKLKEEIKKGKTQKQIAYKYGYGYPSPTLSNRTEKLGFKSNRKAKIRKDGGVNVYIPPKHLKKVWSKSNAEPLNFDGVKKFCYSIDRVTEHGDIIIRPHNNVWRKIKQ